MKFDCQFKMQKKDGKITIEPCDYRDNALFDKLLSTGKEYYAGEFRNVRENKSYDQVKTVHKLVDVIWRSLNMELRRNPTRKEHEELYEDLKWEYADKRASRVNPEKLVPVGLRESDTVSASRLIQNLINLLADSCDLNVEQQTEVRAIFQEWEAWRYEKESDSCTEEEWRKTHIISEASGLGGVLHLHHIVTRGASEKLRDVSANWVCLTVEEHEELHRKGEAFFLARFPHLKPKFEKAHSLKYS